jgi:hypothetical protein
LATVALVVAACSGGAKPPATGRSTTSTSGTASVASGTWSGAIRLAPGVDLGVVSCPVAGDCVAGSTTGTTYALVAGKAKSLGPAVPSPSPQGADYLACPSVTLCVAVPATNQAAQFNGSAWGTPVTIASAQGFTAIGCAGTTFCAAIDGEGNAYLFNGIRWSGNLGAWGAANSISCASAQFCVAAEGGPSIWNGRTWSQPNDTDSQGQLNSVSCASPVFCDIVDSDGDVLTWNGSVFSAPLPIATELPATGTNASGLTGVSCPSTTFCVAVDSIGRAFTFNGTKWSAGTLIDNGHTLTSVSCPSAAYCAAVDRQGKAFVLGGSSKS